MTVATKPPYSIPDMTTIRDIPWNGLNVVSTFSGCGGTCLGYKMAGYKILWASEFVPAAQEVYRLNHPDTFLDVRDIRQVTGTSILDTIGLSKGEVDILEGSPPCASFSTSGRRSATWGKVVKYSDTKQRVDDLFGEFIRIIDELQPRVFIAENVAGLVKGVAKGYFKTILAQMRHLNYQVEARLLNAAWLGVPQARQRIFFMGTRSDVAAPVFPPPLPYSYSLQDVLPYLKRVRLGGKPNNWAKASRPSPTIVQSASRTGPKALFDAGGWIEAEADISAYAIAKEWDELKEGESSTKYFNLVRPLRQRPSPTISATGGNTSAASVTHPTEKRKFSIAELKLISSFPADFQLTGSFTKQWERIGRAVPPLMAKAIAESIKDNVLCK
jgi:DNA (cytosine-5)-methyltransferase 1